jgi:hypothetical protein
VIGYVGWIEKRNQSDITGYQANEYHCFFLRTPKSNTRR